ncbi:XRE family transcriptional regulator [Suilimivivens sp.]|uniref:XRE family transcriptional regulator n=1 Tax=Suilimivivens sp. TaxID=2981669 RepID=UPI003076E17F
MNKNKLKAKMVEHGDTSEILAEVLGIHRSCLSAKMNNYRGAEFNQTEIKVMAKRYEMTDAEVIEIFFE